jgi:hypothetical protein
MPLSQTSQNLARAVKQDFKLPSKSLQLRHNRHLFRTFYRRTTVSHHQSVSTRGQNLGAPIEMVECSKPRKASSRRSRSCPSLGPPSTGGNPLGTTSSDLGTPGFFHADNGHDDEGSVTGDSTDGQRTHPPDHTLSTPAAAHFLGAVKTTFNRRSIASNLLDTYSLPMSPIRRECTDDYSRSGQQYIMVVCRALMSFGAPTHRLERYMQSTAESLGISLNSFYLPGCMILSFTDTVKGSSEVHLVRCNEALNLGKLIKIHAVHKR